MDAKAHPVAGVCCDTGVAADACVTPGLKRAYSASREPSPVRIGASEAPRGAGVESDSGIVCRIHLLAKKLSAIGRSVWAFFTYDKTDGPSSRVVSGRGALPSSCGFGFTFGVLGLPSSLRMAYLNDTRAYWYSMGEGRLLISRLSAHAAAVFSSAHQPVQNIRSQDNSIMAL